MRKVTVYQDAEGNCLTSFTESFLAWREWCRTNHLPFEATVDSNGICDICHGWQELPVEQYGRMLCICYVAQEIQTRNIVLAPFRSQMKPQNRLSSFQPWGRTGSMNDLITIKDRVSRWLEWPDCWLTFFGIFGCGKTHLMQAMVHELGPIALYITAGDFESKVFRAMKGTNYGLEDMLSAIEEVPFLFLDDLGSDYGSDFPQAMLRRIIDYRYSKAKEYITVVSTNVDPESLRKDYDGRIADRILGKDVAEVHWFQYVKSWRHYGTS